MRYRLLKELPDVEIGSIGNLSDGIVFFNNTTGEKSYYYLTFVKSKPDWFEEVKEYDFDLFKRLIEARDKISMERGNILVIVYEGKVCSNLEDDISSPFNYNCYNDMDKFIEENRNDLYKFLTM